MILIWRRGRFLAWFLAAVAIAAASGAAYEYWRLGWTRPQAAQRVAGAVRSSFSALAARLDGETETLVRQGDLIRQAALDTGAARRLFESIRTTSPEVSITVYSAEGEPLAWAGRPSDLVRAVVTGPGALRVAPGASGPRLFRVQPVLDGSSEARRRVGTVVAECPLPSAGAPPGMGRADVVWPTALVDVPLRARYQGAGADPQPNAFVLTDSAGKALLEGRVDDAAVAAARRLVRRRTAAALLGICALFCAWLVGPILDWRRGAPSLRAALYRTGLCTLAIVLARLIAWAGLGLWSAEPSMGTLADTPAFWRVLLRSPFDFALSAAMAVALVALAGDGLARLRTRLRDRRRPTDGTMAVTILLASQAAAGLLAAVLLTAYVDAGRTLTDLNAVDWLRFALHPWEPAPVAAAAGLVLWHAAVLWTAVLALRLPALWFRVPSHGGRGPVVMAAWVLAAGGWCLTRQTLSRGEIAWDLAAPIALAIVLAWSLGRILRWRRHSSRAAAVVALFLALALPALSMYPAAFDQFTRARRQVVESRLGPEATRQRGEVQLRVGRSTTQIDTVADLTEMVRAAAVPAGSPAPTDLAFLVWSKTDLAAFRLTSAIELYGPDGALASRFALNLPEFTSTQQRWKEAGCDWDLFEEVSPFGSQDRRLLHAGRGLCVEVNGRRQVVGAIVIHAMLDYGTLSFLSSHNPYVELFRPRANGTRESASIRDVEFVVYGWSLRPIYASGATAWTLDPDTFRRVYRSRDPFWSRQVSGNTAYQVYLANDRGSIYALGFPVVSGFGHLMNLAELLALAGATCLLLMFAVRIGSTVTGPYAERGRDLLSEIRASFYRKLFLAFVAAAVVPVLTLAFVAQAYMTARLRADVEEAALRTTRVAQRVVEDYGLIQERGDAAAVTLSDDILVWLSRIIDQDVNVFDGPRLVATSERDLFASGLLPNRTSADVYRAIVLDRRATYVGEERAGPLSYMLAAAPVRIAGLNALLTVPLTTRQQAIEREIDDLDRRILLAVLAFILIGSAIGYWMAERIADPVNRLQRATARLARGDLDARVAVTSSDELRRLVEAFNQMAGELQRHQATLERTHRLEAWADMARQVAHEIKNPLTPIQLSAEHLRRVHADRGAPLSPVLEGCVDSILSQVRLLRQIAAEFSSFASSPTPRPVDTNLADLVSEIVQPYRAGLPARVTLEVEVADALPVLSVDRSLIGRALTNMIENALHAMPGGGSLTIVGGMSPEGGSVRVSIRDSGVGMDRGALERIFEPYFSTKAVGTGLGLTIAKRNVELHGGRIEVDSAPGRGTTVTVTLPVPPPADGGAASTRGR